MKSTFTLFLFFVSLGAFCQPGTFQNAFSENGWDSLTVNNNGVETHKVIVQPDGKILICTEASVAGEGHEANLMRYLPDGAPDPEFGDGDGHVRTFIDYGFNYLTRAQDMVLQPDGKILIVGDQFYNSERVIRLLPDGHPDPTYGNVGMVEFPRDFQEFLLKCVLLSDNSLIVAGTRNVSIPGNSFGVQMPMAWKIGPNGERDMSFGDGGTLTLSYPDWETLEATVELNQLAVLENDILQFNVTSPSPEGVNLLLARFDTNGNPVASWGENGYHTLEFHSQNWEDNFSSEDFLPDGSMVLTFPMSVDEENPDQTQTKIYKVLTDGTIDPGFASPIVGPIHGFTKPFTLVTNGNHIYLVTYNTLGENYITVYGFDSNGNALTEFGTNGVATLDGNEYPGGWGQYGADTDANGNLYTTSVSAPYENNDLNVLTTLAIELAAETSALATRPFSRKEITIYPCPAQSEITLSGIVQGETLEILTLSGVPLKTVRAHKSGPLTLDLSDLSSGIYLLRNFETGQIQKFILTK